MLHQSPNQGLRKKRKLDPKIQILQQLVALSKKKRKKKGMSIRQKSFTFLRAWETSLKLRKMGLPCKHMHTGSKKLWSGLL